MNADAVEKMGVVEAVGQVDARKVLTFVPDY